MCRLASLAVLLVLASLPAAAVQPESAPVSAEDGAPSICKAATPVPGLEAFLDPSPQTHIGRECGSCVEFPGGDCDSASTCQQACECQCDHQFDQCSSGCVSPGCWFNCEQQWLNCSNCCSLL